VQTHTAVGYLETNRQRRSQIFQWSFSITYSCWQRRNEQILNLFATAQCNEHFKPRILLFFLGNGAMNAPQYWQQRIEDKQNKHEDMLYCIFIPWR
jgi:hypothetical protein